MTSPQSNPEMQNRSGNMAASDVVFAAHTPADTPGNPGPCGKGVIHSNPDHAGNRGLLLSDLPGASFVGCRAFSGAKRIARLTIKKGAPMDFRASLFSDLRGLGYALVPVWATWEVWA